MREVLGLHSQHCKRKKKKKDDLNRLKTQHTEWEKNCNLYIQLEIKIQNIEKTPKAQQLNKNLILK
jgi:hypothetical protein